jgi:RNA polymerase sigma-70 factor, ECF subfamily
MKTKRIKMKKIKHPVYLTNEVWQEVKEANDNELIEMVRSNIPRTYRELVKRYEKKLFAYLYRLVGNREEAEDLLQNVFVKVYRNIESYDTQKKFSSWIYRIAHNEAVNFLKKRSKRHLISIEDVQTSKDKLEITDTGKSPIDAWISKELKKEMDEALEKLPPKYKEVLMLRFYFDKSYEEMSEILGRPINTVGTLLNRAKKKLMEIMKKRWK